jgi:hypothetical protein
VNAYTKFSDNPGDGKRLITFPKIGSSEGASPGYYYGRPAVMFAGLISKTVPSVNFT